MTLFQGDIYLEPGTETEWFVVGWGALQETHDVVVRLRLVANDDIPDLFERCVYSGDFLHQWTWVRAGERTNYVHVGGSLSFDPAGPLAERRP